MYVKNLLLFLKKLTVFTTKQLLQCLLLVRFCVLYRIKPHAPPFEQVSVNFFEFQSCDRTTQAECLSRLLKN